MIASAIQIDSFFQLNRKVAKTNDVEISKTIENAKALKAVASITFDDAFAFHNVKEIETAKGRFIAMLSEVFKDKDGNEGE